MTWNYRLCKETVNYSGESFESFTVREVYYDEDNRISSVSSDPVDIVADGIDGITWMLDKIKESLSKDVLDLNSLDFWNNN